MAKTQQTTVNGLVCKGRSFKVNVLVYKNIGGSLRIRGRRREIKRRRVTVYLQNRYFMKDEFALGVSAQLVEYVPPFVGDQVRFSIRKWRHWHYAWGFGLKLKLESASPTSGVVGYMPLVGVLTETTVSVEHNGTIEQETFITKKGSVPSTPRVFTPRVGLVPISVKGNLEDHAAPGGSVSVRQTFAEAGALRDRPDKSVREGLFALAH